MQNLKYLRRQVRWCAETQHSRDSAAEREKISGELLRRRHFYSCNKDRFLSPRKREGVSKKEWEGERKKERSAKARWWIERSEQ